MKVVKYPILLVIALVATGWSCPGPLLAESSIPVSCVKIKHSMVNACVTRKLTACKRQTDALNRCMKKSAFRQISKSTPGSSLVCTMVYQPVCGLTEKGYIQLFGNSCLAKTSGATEVALEQCIK